MYVTLVPREGNEMLHQLLTQWGCGIWCVTPKPLADAVDDVPLSAQAYK